MNNERAVTNEFTKPRPKLQNECGPSEQLTYDYFWAPWTSSMPFNRDFNQEDPRFFQVGQNVGWNAALNAGLSSVTIPASQESESEYTAPIGNIGIDSNRYMPTRPHLHQPSEPFLPISGARQDSLDSYDSTYVMPSHQKTSQAHQKTSNPLTVQTLYLPVGVATASATSTELSFQTPKTLAQEASVTYSSLLTYTRMSEQPMQSPLGLNSQENRLEHQFIRPYHNQIAYSTPEIAPCQYQVPFQSHSNMHPGSQVQLGPPQVQPFTGQSYSTHDPTRFQPMHHMTVMHPGSQPQVNMAYQHYPEAAQQGFLQLRNGHEFPMYDYQSHMNATKVTAPYPNQDMHFTAERQYVFPTSSAVWNVEEPEVKSEHSFQHNQSDSLVMELRRLLPSPPLALAPTRPDTSTTSTAKKTKRKSKFTKEQDALIVQLKSEGRTWVEVADAAGVWSYLAARNRYQVILGQQGNNNLLSWSEKNRDALQPLLDQAELEKWNFIATELSKATGKQYLSKECRDFVRSMFLYNPAAMGVTSELVDMLEKERDVTLRIIQQENENKGER